MKHLIAFIVLVCAYDGSWSQDKTFTLSLYYEINEASSASNLARVDSACATVDDARTQVGIFGYADFLAADHYNQTLSQKRADVIKLHLSKKYSKLNIGTCKGLGEINSKDNAASEGEARQRRVDLVFTLPSKKIIASHPNQVQDESKKVSVPEKKAEAQPEKKIEELSVGESIAVDGLSFIPGKHLVIESSYPVLKKLLQTLKDHPNLKIEIQGHVCCPEPGQVDGLDHDTHTYNLSENRAKSVYQYLVHYGIDKDRLSYKGYGHSQLKVKDEKTPEDEQVNRRVEIKILEN